MAGACCEHVAVYTHLKSHSHRDCLMEYNALTDSSGNPVTCHEAAVFKSASGKLFLYRSKHGDWVVGKVMGKGRNGARLRSQDEDRTKFSQECPCQTKTWEKMDSKLGWVADPDIRIIVRTKRLVLEQPEPPAE